MGLLLAAVAFQFMLDAVTAMVTRGAMSRRAREDA